MKTCDNKSAGQIIRNIRGEIVLIERLNYPVSIALPAGHCDGDDFAVCARKESLEEVRITISQNKKVWEGTINNPCKRLGGDHHEWQVFESRNWRGELKPATDAKRAFWADAYTLSRLMLRTRYFFVKFNLKEEQVGELTLKIFGDPKAPIIDEEWKEEPGLEPVWYLILKKLQNV